jgi:hypothetical protein
MCHKHVPPRPEIKHFNILSADTTENVHNRYRFLVRLATNRKLVLNVPSGAGEIVRAASILGYLEDMSQTQPPYPLGRLLSQLIYAFVQRHNNLARIALRQDDRHFPFTAALRT